MYEPGLIILHAGDQLVGSIVWLIIGFLIIGVLPIILLIVLGIFLIEKFDGSEIKADGRKIPENE